MAVRSPAERSIGVVVGCLDQIVRPGLSGALRSEPSLEIVADDLDVSGLERAVGELEPGLAIVSQVDAVSLISRLRVISEPLGVVVLANAPSSQYGWQLLAAGATCIAQSSPLEEIVSAILLTGRGGRVFLGADGERVERLPLPAIARLTPTELSVVRRLSCDIPYRAIALELGITVETVRKHTVNIRTKLAVTHRRDLIGLPLPHIHDS